MEFHGIDDGELWDLDGVLMARYIHMAIYMYIYIYIYYLSVYVYIYIYTLVDY